MEGQTSTGLSPRGQQQASLLASRLIAPSQARQLPTHLYSSPLLRAAQTATTIAKGLHSIKHPLSIRYSEALKEIHPGIFQGLTWHEATTQYPDLCHQLMQSLAWQPVPKAESLVDARARGQQWITELLSQHQPGDVIWAVSHAGLMIQMMSALMGCDRTWKLTIDHTAIFEFWLASTHHPTQTKTLRQNQFNPEYWILRRFNDTGHLTSN